MQQRGGVDQVLLARVEAEHLGHGAGVARHGAGMAGGHRVAHRQRLHHGREHADLQRPELFRPPRELLAALIRLHARAREMVEDNHDHHQQHQRGQAEPLVAEGHTGRQERRRELVRQHGPVHRSEGLTDAENASQAQVRGGRGEPRGVREHEDDHDGGRERDRIAGVDRHQRAPAEQRDRRVGRRVPDASPTGQDRDPRSPPPARCATSAIARTSAGTSLQPRPAEPDRHDLPTAREEEQKDAQEVTPNGVSARHVRNSIPMCACGHDVALHKKKMQNLHTCPIQKWCPRPITGPMDGRSSHPSDTPPCRAGRERKEAYNGLEICESHATDQVASCERAPSGARSR